MHDVIFIYVNEICAVQYFVIIKQRFWRDVSTQVLVTMVLVESGWWCECPVGHCAVCGVHRCVAYLVIFIHVKSGVYLVPDSVIWHPSPLMLGGSV